MGISKLTGLLCDSGRGRPPKEGATTLVVDTANVVNEIAHFKGYKNEPAKQKGALKIFIDKFVAAGFKLHFVDEAPIYRKKLKSEMWQMMDTLGKLPEPEEVEPKPKVDWADFDCLGYLIDTYVQARDSGVTYEMAKGNPDEYMAYLVREKGYYAVISGDADFACYEGSRLMPMPVRRITDCEESLDTRCFSLEDVAICLGLPADAGAYTEIRETLPLLSGDKVIKKLLEHYYYYIINDGGKEKLKLLLPAEGIKVVVKVYGDKKKKCYGYEPVTQVINPEEFNADILRRAKQAYDAILAHELVDPVFKEVLKKQVERVRSTFKAGFEPTNYFEDHPAAEAYHNGELPYSSYDILINGEVSQRNKEYKNLQKIDQVGYLLMRSGGDIDVVVDKVNDLKEKVTKAEFEAMFPESFWKYEWWVRDTSGDRDWRIEMLLRAAHAYLEEPPSDFEELKKLGEESPAKLYFKLIMRAINDELNEQSKGALERMFTNLQSKQALESADAIDVDSSVTELFKSAAVALTDVARILNLQHYGGLPLDLSEIFGVKGAAQEQSPLASGKVGPSPRLPPPHWRVQSSGGTQVSPGKGNRPWPSGVGELGEQLSTWRGGGGAEGHLQQTMGADTNPNTNLSPAPSQAPPSGSTSAKTTGAAQQPRLWRDRPKAPKASGGGGAWGSGRPQQGFGGEEMVPAKRDGKLREATGA